MDKTFRPIIGLFFTFLLIFVLYYINTPQYIVSSYWQYLSIGQYEKADELTSEKIFELDLQKTSQLEKVFFNRTKLNNKQTQISNNIAYVSGVLTLPDIALALSSDDDLLKALQEVPTVEKEYTFELQKTNKGWKIKNLYFGGG